MADDVENDDQWLYGDGPEGATLLGGDAHQQEEPETDEAPPELELQEEDKPEEEEQEIEDAVPQIEPEEAPAKEPEPEVEDEPGPPGAEEEEEGEHEEEQNGEASDKDDSEEDSDDDVNVVIGDIKASPAYTSLNIKRGGLLTSSVTDKSKQPQQQTGKFTVEEFDQMGMINGVAASEFNLDSLEEKPWRKPGADITDYFNYGFNEDTWKAYCERQKRLRVNESGVGLIPLNSIGLPRGPVPIMNDNSKYSGTFAGVRKAGPPPGRRMTGAIDVIGGAAQAGAKIDAPKENVIQVMTADRREYSRKPPGFPDMSMPPPSAFEEFQPEFGFNPEPEPFYGGYEPVQDLQWGTGGNPNWAPNEIKSLTPGPTMVPAPVPPVNLAPPMVPPVMKDGTPPSRRHESRDRDREMSRSRSEKPRDRDRERSHRRERSRSRSRRHKSRSRSPSHRHRKKKSRRHEDSD